MKNKFYVLFFKSICFIYYRWVQGHCPCWCSRKYPSDPLRCSWARAVKEGQQFWSLVIFPCLVLSAVPTVVLGTQASESSIPRNFIASVAWHEFQMGALFCFVLSGGGEDFSLCFLVCFVNFSPNVWLLQTKSPNFEYESNIWFVLNAVMSSKCK